MNDYNMNILLSVYKHVAKRMEKQISSTNSIIKKFRYIWRLHKIKRKIKLLKREVKRRNYKKAKEKWRVSEVE